MARPDQRRKHIADQNRFSRRAILLLAQQHIITAFTSRQLAIANTLPTSLPPSSLSKKEQGHATKDNGRW